MALISVFTDQIRPERARGYEALVAELAAEARKKQEAWRWTAHQVSVGPLARMYYVSQHPDHADIEKHGDPLALFTRVLGEKRGEKHLDESNECLVSTERVLAVQRPDLSYPNEPPERVAPVASLAAIRARPGHNDTVEDLLRKFAEAIPKTGESARIGVAQQVTGDMQVYWLVRPLERLADLDQQSVGRDLLIKAFGADEGARIFRTGLEGADQVQREITTYREDLSNPPS
jgi:hypothetical protein